MVNFESLKKGALILGGLLVVFIAFYASLMIGGLVTGSIANTATSGAVNVSTAMNTALTGYETGYISTASSLSNNAPLIVGLVAIVVIISVFGFKFNFGGSRKGGVE